MRSLSGRCILSTIEEWREGFVEEVVAYTRIWIDSPYFATYVQ